MTKRRGAKIGEVTHQSSQCSSTIPSLTTNVEQSKQTDEDNITLNINRNHIYDESDDEEDGRNGIYDRSCPIGQFFLNPWQFLQSRLYRIWLRCFCNKSNTRQSSLPFFSRWCPGVQQRPLSHLPDKRQQAHQQKQHHKKWLRCIFWIVGVVLIIDVLTTWILFYHLYTKSEHQLDYNENSNRHFDGRGYNMNKNLEVPIVIPALNLRDVLDLDVGGFLYEYKPFPSWKSLTAAEPVRQKDDEADFGGLFFKSLRHSSSFQRVINPLDRFDEQNMRDALEAAEKKKNGKSKKLKNYFSDDDDTTYTRTTSSTNPHYNSTTGSTYIKSPKCRHQSWQKLYYPNCNLFHEYDITRLWDSLPNIISPNPDLQSDYESVYISHGYYRDVWILDQKVLQSPPFQSFSVEQINDPDQPYEAFDAMALKMIRYSKHEIKHSTMATVRKDALIMERLSSSPRIVDIYGHCSTSVGVELVEKEVEEVIVPGSGYTTQNDLDQFAATSNTDSITDTNTGNGGHQGDVKPKNHYTPTQKLEIALAMAESIADLHGFPDGVIVHDDIQLCQWLQRSRDGKLKLGDFNRAEVMLWDDERQQYCKYNNGEGFGNYRAPEEFAARDLNEQIDVFSFGNNIYALLTGLWVFYENEDDEVVQGKVIKGELPFIDKRYKNRSFAERKLIEIMEKCWIYDPSKRVDIFEVVRFLRDAVNENSELDEELDMKNTHASNY